MVRTVMMATSDKLLDVLIVDDHPVVISGCRSLFASAPDIRLSEASNEKAGHEAYLEIRPDISIIDINLPGLSGFELLRRIREENPAAKIIVFSMNDEPAFVVRAIELGANGYVSKGDDPQHLLSAVRSVANGQNFVAPHLAQAVAFSTASVRASPASQLSPKELEILRLLSHGKNIAEIAETLNISYKPVANSTSRLKQKLGARSHSDLIRFAVELNLRLPAG
jgi:DNA-binding NarL/FixJ family response regulator